MGDYVIEMIPKLFPPLTLLIPTMVIISFFMLSVWAEGTILKAAIGIPKWYVIFLYIPIINIYFVLHWAWEAHKELLYQEDKKRYT